MVIVAGVDTDECDAGYGVTTEEDFENHDGDRFSMMWGNSTHCETFENFAAAMKSIEAKGGVLVNVHAALAY